MYASYQKGRELGFLTKKIHRDFTNRVLSTFYPTGYEQVRYDFGLESGYRLPSWTNNASWGWASDIMNTNTDYPSFESYYEGIATFTNSRTVSVGATADLLTKYLNAVGYNFTIGYSNNYTWTTGGWATSNTNQLAEIPRYKGFLKMLYTGGMVSQLPGYYLVPAGSVPSIFGHNGFAGIFPTNLPPHWLLQIEASSRVHAQFTWLEDWLFNADLISGPQYHLRMYGQPAYEFTNTVNDVYCRVMARKHREREEWLVTAWASYGEARDVTVNIPDLGDVTVTAHPEASIYTATVAGGLKLLDATGQHVGRKVGRADKLRVRRD
jgi:hypothetical protein